MSRSLVDQVWHPLLNQRSPRLVDVVERCDAEARTTLELAAGFARRRIELQTQLASLAGELQHAPWADPIVAWREPSRGVSPTDLLRAVLARHGDRIAEAAFAMDVGESFGAAVRHCRALATNLGRADDLELDPIWARRWATTTTAIDLAALIGSLTATSLRRLAAFSSKYSEGLVTEDEAFYSVIDQLTGQGIACRFALPMPPAYWDRHDGLAALDQLLVQAPGVVIVGNTHTGRHALIEAWGRRLRTAGPDELRRFGFNIDNFHGGGELEWRGQRVDTWAAIDRGCIAVLSNFGAPLDEPGDAGASLRRFPDYCLDFASDPANEFRIVILMTPDELAHRERQLPALRGVPRVEVPPIAEGDLMLLWICHTLSHEDALGIEIPLPRLIDRLAWRSPARLRDFTARADLLCESELTGCESSVRGLVRRARAEWSASDQRRLARFLDANPAVAAVMGVTGWPELVALADALRGSARSPT